MVQDQGHWDATGADGTSLALSPLSTDVPIRPVPATKNLATRASKRKPKTPRLCGECGYELSPDGDGTCPMCPRLQEIRTVLEPRALAIERPRPDRVASKTQVIRNRALRTSRPRSGASGGDATGATSATSIAIVPVSAQQPVAQATGAAPASPPAAASQAPSPHRRPIRPTPARRHPKASSPGSWGLPALVAVADLLLIALIVFLWFWR
jgi:hypothetical protein